MTVFVNLPALAQGLIGLCMVFLMFAAVINIVMELSHRMIGYAFGQICIVVVLYGMFQCICDICSHMETLYHFLNRMEEHFGQLPLWFFAMLLTCVFMIEVLAFLQNRTWEQEHITSSSIKEAMDDLPVGICCYEPNGQVMMKNNRMENICYAYRKEQLLNAVAFIDALRMQNEHAENDTLLLSVEDRVFSISDRPFSDEEPLLRIMTAADITKQYENTQRLKAQQEEVIQLNKELSDYGKQIVSSITAREVLNAKVKLHDELGANLLAIKRYILNGGTSEERIAIENTLHKNLRYLKNETVAKEKDEYAVILDTAAKLDIRIKVVGELTECLKPRHVIVTAIHECLTNTIRHAGGDELTVILKEEADGLSARFTNNGKPPEDEITERGGLALLRALTQESGGTMQIRSKPEFELILKLPGR